MKTLDQQIQEQIEILRPYREQRAHLVAQHKSTLLLDQEIFEVGKKYKALFKKKYDLEHPEYVEARKLTRLNIIKNKQKGI